MAKIYDAVLRLTDQFSEPLKKAEKHLDNFERKYKQTGNTLWRAHKQTEAIGKGFLKYVTAPVVAGAGLCVKAFKDVDEGLDIITTKTGATGKDMKEFEGIFKSMSLHIPEDMKTIGESIGEVNTQFGLKGEQLEKASTKIVQFAKINGQDVTSSSIKAKQSMDAMGVSGDKLGLVLDSVTKTAQNTGQSTEKIFDLLTKSAPSLKALNMGFSESAEFLGQLEKSGLDTTKTFSYMSKAQVNFAKEGKDLNKGLEMIQERLKNTSSVTEKLTLMSKYFGTKGAVFMLDAVNRGALDFAKFSNAQKEAMGSVESTFNEVVDPIDRFKQAINGLEVVGAKFFKASEKIWKPWLDKVVNGLEILGNKIEKMPEDKLRVIIKTLLGLAAIGPTFLIMSKGFKIFSKFYFKMSDFAKATRKAGGILKWLTSPTHLIIIGLIALIAVIVLVIKNWDKIKAKAEQVFPGITQTVSRMGKNLSIIFKQLFKFLKFVTKRFLKAWAVVWGAISTFVSQAVEYLKPIIKSVGEILDGLIEFIAGVFTSNWKKAWEGVVKIFCGIFDGLKALAKAPVNAIISMINTAIGGINKLKLPDWVPGIGGKGINIPLIPQLAKGTKNWLGGMAQINERGGEIVDLPRGSRVIPHDKSIEEAYTKGKNSVKNDNSLIINIPKIAETVVIREDADIDKIINSLVKELKIAKQNKINSRGVMV